MTKFSSRAGLLASGAREVTMEELDWVSGGAPDDPDGADTFKDHAPIISPRPRPLDRTYRPGSRIPDPLSNHITFGAIGGAGLVSGNSQGGGSEYNFFGLGAGVNLKLGYASNSDDARSSARADGLIGCAGLCTDIIVDPFGDDAMYQISIGFGLFFGQNTEIPAR